MKKIFVIATGPKNFIGYKNGKVSYMESLSNITTHFESREAVENLLLSGEVKTFSYLKIEELYTN